MAFEKVVVAGGGVLGSQIAFQSAYCGLGTCIWLRSEGSIGRTRPKLDQLVKDYHAQIDAMEAALAKSRADGEPMAPGVWAMGIADPDDFDPARCHGAVDAAAENLRLELDLSAAVADADVVVQSMAEQEEAKIEFYKRLAPLMAEKTVLVTNSSSLLPSKFTRYTGRPDRYLAMHFANHIWRNNIAEVMAQPKTSQESFDAIMEFAGQIRMQPLPVRKEKAGYLLNSMLIPFLFSAMDLYVNGISEPESIDTAWVRGTGAPNGPFQILDVVGLVTAYNIVQPYTKVPGFMAPYNFKGISRMLKEKIDAGETGVAAGKGFYTYGG